MDHQEQFLHDQIRFIQQTLEDKEDHFEHLLQEDRARRIPPAKDSMTEEERKDRLLNMHIVPGRLKSMRSEVLRYHAKHVIHFDEGKDKLIEIYEEKKAEIERKYMEELLALEMELESSLSRLMDILAPPHFDKEDTG